MNAARTTLLSAALVLAACPVLADDAPPAIRQFDIETTQRLGRAIYDQDQMAWKASDVLTGEHSEEYLKAAKLHGWIVTTSTDANTVRFLDEGANGPEVFCDVAFTPEMSQSCVTPKVRALSADEMALYAARTTALAGVARRCTEIYNTVILRDPQGDGWLVWALAATRIPGVVVYGGHYRFTISNDGKTIQQADALSRGCTTVEPPDPARGAPVALFYMQLVSEIPVETVVWLSLQHKLPIYISTPDKAVWKVDGDRIVRIQQSGAP